MMLHGNIAVKQPPSPAGPLVRQAVGQNTVPSLISLAFGETLAVADYMDSFVKNPVCNTSTVLQILSYLTREALIVNTKR